MSSVRRTRKKAPINTSGPVDYSQTVGSSLKRERVSVLAPLSHAESFDNPQASSTKIRSGFVTQPGSIMGGARRLPPRAKKGFTEKASAILTRNLSRKPGQESARTRNAALVAHLGLKEVPRGMWPKKDTAAIHASAIKAMGEQRVAKALEQPWGPRIAGQSLDDELKHRQKIAEERGNIFNNADPSKITRHHGFGRKKGTKTHKKKKR